VRADSRDADESRGHEQESLHGETPFRVLRVETPNPAVLIHRRVKPTGSPPGGTTPRPIKRSHPAV
jgi:hypothetical protein